MLRVRLQQQEALSERAKIAAEERKKKEMEEHDRKNKGTKKKQLTMTAKDTGGFNPLQPWSSSSGGGYKYVPYYYCIEIKSRSAIVIAFYKSACTHLFVFACVVLRPQRRSVCGAS
jgi:hypothetical protein